jgi:hypothetical protein
MNGFTAPHQECRGYTYREPRSELWMERVKGIEPSYAAWEAAVLPLNYTRVGAVFYRGYLC